MISPRKKCLSRPAGDLLQLSEIYPEISNTLRTCGTTVCDRTDESLTEEFVKDICSTRLVSEFRSAVNLSNISVLQF